MKKLIAALVAAVLFGGCATTGALQMRIAALEEELVVARGWDGRASSTTPPSASGGYLPLAGEEDPIPEAALYATTPWSEQGTVYLDRLPPGRIEKEVIRFSNYSTAKLGPLLVMLGDDLPPVPVDWRAPPSIIHLPGGSVARLPLIPSGSTGYVLPDLRWSATAITIVRFRGDPRRGFVVECVARRSGWRVSHPWGELISDIGCTASPEVVQAVEEQLLRLRVPGT